MHGGETERSRTEISRRSRTFLREAVEHSKERWFESGLELVM